MLVFYRSAATVTLRAERLCLCDTVSDVART